jgi:hypothetical protein
MYKTVSPYSLRLRRALLYPDTRPIVTRESVVAWKVARILPSPAAPKLAVRKTVREVTITKEDSGLVGDDQPTFLCAAA